MRSLLPLAFVVAATLTTTACEWSEPVQDADFDWQDSGTWNTPAEFARGETLEDHSTMWSETKGFALGSDEFGAIGMVGMVCSFATIDGYIRMDVDSDEGDEVVVDAMALANGGFVTLAVDGAQITLAEFPDEWSGAVTVDVVFPGGDLDAAGLSHDGVIVARTEGSSCVIERMDLDGGISDALAIDGACASHLEVDAASGTAWIATTTATYELAANGAVSQIGAPVARLAYADGVLARATEAGVVTARAGGVDTWTADVGPTVVGLEWMSGGRVAVALSTATAGTLVVLDGQGAVIEQVATTEPIQRMQASPTGGMLAVRGPTALHLVRVK